MCCIFCCSNTKLHLGGAIKSFKQAFGFFFCQTAAACEVLACNTNPTNNYFFLKNDKLGSCNSIQSGILTVNNTHSHAATSRAHGQHVEPLIRLRVVRLNGGQTCQDAQQQV